MATGLLIEMTDESREAFAGVLRFYDLAKRQEWQVRDLPWGELPPIPEGKGSPVRQARRKDMWRSVLTQQLHEAAPIVGVHLQRLAFDTRDHRPTTTGLGAGPSPPWGSG